MKRVGIVGGGQLGRMLAEAAREMGLTTIVLDPTPGSSAAQVADKAIVGDFKSADAIRELAAEVDVLTFEIESANADALAELAEKGFPVHPSPQTLALIKDKFAQKTFLREQGIPVADFIKTDTRDEVAVAGEQFDYPFLLKARFDAYDGRGNAVVHDASEIDAAMQKLGGKNLYAEKFVPFLKELAVIAARGVGDDVAVYPVVETIQKNNICHEVFAPAQVQDTTRAQAEQLGANVMQALKGVGVFGIEMFLTESAVLVNEIAPRVHNSGHFTIEACMTSQFKQHLLAITGQPLGDPAMKVSAAVMVNILGDRSAPAAPQGIEKALAVPGVAVHLYGKIETRPERKMGHLTAVGEDLTTARERAELARSLISI